MSVKIVLASLTDVVTFLADNAALNRADRTTVNDQLTEILAMIDTLADDNGATVDLNAPSAGDLSAGQTALSNGGGLLTPLQPAQVLASSQTSPIASQASIDAMSNVPAQPVTPTFVPAAQPVVASSTAPGTPPGGDQGV